MAVTAATAVAAADKAWGPERRVSCLPSRTSSTLAGGFAGMLPTGLPEYSVQPDQR